MPVLTSILQKDRFHPVRQHKLIGMSQQVQVNEQNKTKQNFRQQRGFSITYSPLNQCRLTEKGNETQIYRLLSETSENEWTELMVV